MVVARRAALAMRRRNKVHPVYVVFVRNPMLKRTKRHVVQLCNAEYAEPRRWNVL